MSEKTATIIGATGMTGALLLQHLLQNEKYTYIRMVVRRPVPITQERVEVKLVNFTDTESLHLALHGSDVVFCCVGTTHSAVKGDKALYWKIDHDIPVHACQLAKAVGCKKFVLLSAIGSDSSSTHFYRRLKGKTEEDVIAVGIQQLHIIQPGLLLGPRQESRPAEKIAQLLLKPLSAVMYGAMRKYRAIAADEVAKAMMAAASRNVDGVHIYTYDAIRQLSATAL